MSTLHLLSEQQLCMLLPSCWFVYSTNHQNNNLLSSVSFMDAKLTSPVCKNFPPIINGIHLYGEPIPIHEMLQYKAIVCLEGNGMGRETNLQYYFYYSSCALSLIMVYAFFTQFEYSLNF
jgi:hypothetical protein